MAGRCLRAAGIVKGGGWSLLATTTASGKLGSPMSMTAFLPSALGWVFLGLALLCGLGLARTPAPRFAPWAWWLLLGCSLVCFRWPLIRLAHELFPDESQLLAGAITLWHDPMFWRSVDGNTAGPLDYYALMPAALCHDAHAYVATRLIATGLIWGALVVTGETVVLLTGCALARLAALPALLFIAFTTSPEFIHYSTELVPGLLLALAVYAIARREKQATRANLWAAALLLGAVPWAKLQAAPLAAALGLFLVIREWLAGRRGDTLLAIAAACVPTLVVLLALGLTGETENMLTPYIAQNLLYTQSGRIPLSGVIQQQWLQALTAGYVAAWLAGSVIFGAFASWNLRKAPSRSRHLALGALALLVAAAACAFAPGRPYPHYLHLLELPLTLLLGLLFAAAWTQPAASLAPSRWAPGLFIVCLILPQVALKLSGRTDIYEQYNHVYTVPNPAHRELVARMQAVAKPGEQLGLWGWRSALYVETGMPQATCLAHTESVLVAGPSHPYYKRRYLEKLVENSPPIFVDAVGPGNFRFTDRNFGHEVIPFLKKWIGDNYTLVADLDGCRLYVRRDRLAATPPR